MRWALVTALVLAAATAAPTGARAADECRGLMVCIPVAGPWVAVPAPTRAVARPHVLYELRCPRGSVVGGTDARVTSRALDLVFAGALGSPVSPGVTTSTAALFEAVYTGSARSATSFRPFVGCIPTSGGGRSTTSVVQLRPGRPTVRRVRNVRLRAGAQTVVARCRPDERLVSSAHAVAFRTRRPPSEGWIEAVPSSRREAAGRVVARVVRGSAVPRSVRVEVQVQAVCARSGQ